MWQAQIVPEFKNRLKADKKRETNNKQCLQRVGGEINVNLKTKLERDFKEWRGKEWGCWHVPTMGSRMRLPVGAFMFMLGSCKTSPPLRWLFPPRPPKPNTHHTRYIRLRDYCDVQLHVDILHCTTYVQKNQYSKRAVAEIQLNLARQTTLLLGVDYYAGDLRLIRTWQKNYDLLRGRHARLQEEVACSYGRFKRFHAARV